MLAFAPRLQKEAGMATQDKLGSGPAAAAEDAEGGIERLTRVLAQADLDCWCRENLTRAIERFEALEAQRRQRRSLDAAYAGRREILGLLVFLEDLDRIMDPAFDRAVCAEMAQVFDDMAAAARRGADSLRTLAEAEQG